MMKYLLIPFIWATLTLSVNAFNAPTPFSEQVKEADTVLRIVVVQIGELQTIEQPGYSGVSDLAKCRIVTDYTGSFAENDFVYIQTSYRSSEDPPSLVAGQDYIICLETMKGAQIAHPVSYDSAHEITGGELDDPRPGKTNVKVTVKEFEAIVRTHLKQKQAEQDGGGKGE